MENNFLTIFTPTFNRKVLLTRLYEKLCQQTCKDFCWLIVDDGSNDNTEELVKNWIQEAKIEIIYYYQKNHGLSSAYNCAIENLHTELAVCVDSDDYLESDVVEKIKNYWSVYGVDEHCAGLVGLDADPDGNLISASLDTGEPYNFLEENPAKEYGDKKIVVRSKLYKEVYPVKLYPDEKGISPHILHLKICEQYYFIQVNEILCTVDYQMDGMGAGMIKQYVNSPKSFADLKDYVIQHKKMGLLKMIKAVILYDACCMLGKELAKRLLYMPKKYLTWTLLPVGYLAKKTILHKYYRGKSSARKRKRIK